MKAKKTTKKNEPKGKLKVGQIGYLVETSWGIDFFPTWADIISLSNPITGKTIYQVEVKTKQVAKIVLG